MSGVRPTPRNPTRCIGCGTLFIERSPSGAHIVPNALGGRLVPKDLLCGACNGSLNDIADNCLVKAFDALPTLLQIPQQRGKHPARPAETRDGRKVRVESDGGLTVMGVRYRVDRGEEETILEFSVPDRQTAMHQLWALMRNASCG